MSARAAALAACLVVALAPGDAAAQEPVSPQEIEALKRGLEWESRSHVEAFFEASGDNGGLNDRLAFWRYGARLSLKLGSDALVLAGQRTRYSSGDDLLQAWATRFSAAYRRRLSERTEGRLELGVTHFDTDATTLDGSASLTLRAGERGRVVLGAGRLNVEESFLSIAGVRPVVGPFAGELVGTVMESRVFVSGDYRLPYRLDVFGELALGSRSGEQVPSNSFKRAGGGLGFSALAREEARAVSLLRISVSLDYFGFGDDRLGYGGASLLDRRGRPVPLERLGSDGIPPDPGPGNPGVGGYFSPERFVSVLGRASVKGRSGTALDYEAWGFLGSQSYTGSDARVAAGFSAQVVFHLGAAVSAPVTALWEDYGPFTRRAFLARLLVRF